MRKVNQTISEIVGKIQELKGKTISMQVTRGRKKIEELVGKIEYIYPSVFVVSLKDHIPSTMSYSFSDVLCGDVKIKSIEQ